MTIQPNQNTLRTLLFDPDTQGLVLYVIILYLFGERVHGDADKGIEPMDTLEMWFEIQEAYGDLLPDENENKINAVLMVTRDELFFHDQLVFASVVNSLYDGDLGDLVNKTFEDPTAPEMVWSIIEVELLREEEEGLPEFGTYVQAYINEIFSSEQDSWDTLEDEVSANYADMLARLRSLGVSPQQIKLLDTEYGETLEMMEEESGLA